jgi:hypothetical protein
MSKETYKNYDQTKNKIQVNWEDVRYLIALFNEVLLKIDLLDKKVDRFYTSINNIYEDEV